MKTEDWSKAFNMRLRGLARLKFDAYCFEVHLATGRSVKLSYQEGFRALVMYPERFVGVEVRPHTCTACGKLYGSRYCWVHEERFTKPDPARLAALLMLPTDNDAISEK